MLGAARIGELFQKTGESEIVARQEKGRVGHLPEIAPAGSFGCSRDMSTRTVRIVLRVIAFTRIPFGLRRERTFKVPELLIGKITLGRHLFITDPHDSAPQEAPSAALKTGHCTAHSAGRMARDLRKPLTFDQGQRARSRRKALSGTSMRQACAGRTITSSS